MQSISFTDFESVLNLRGVEVLSSAVVFTIYIMSIFHLPFVELDV